MTDTTTPSADGSNRRRATRSGPENLRRIVIPALLAVASIVALLVAFNSCSDPYDQGEGLVTPIGQPTLSPTPTTPSPTPTDSSTPTPTVTSSPTVSASATPTPTASETASPSPTPTVAPKRPVVILNGTTTIGLAAAYRLKVTRAGWNVVSIGNWTRSSVSATTIFYPSGFKDSAKRLTDDLSGTQLTREALSGMSSTQLTIVVAN
ncbi:MAG: LytR C-terminal domain-containing protein [Actinomycetes bacterium]